MSDELYGFDADDADKIVRVAREYDRNMGSRIEKEDIRLSDRSVAVRLTGPRSSTNSDMYPGQIISWKPGPLAAAEPSGAADSTSFEEYDDHWWASKNEDGEVANDCWVIVSSLDVGFLADDPTGTVLVGIVVGEHPTTKASVVLHSFRPEDTSSGSGGSGSSGSGFVAPGRLIGTKYRPACEGGVLRVYSRDQYQDASMRVTDGPEQFAYTAGCCECAGDAGSGSGSGSGGGGGAPVTTSCCADVPRTLYLSLSAGGTVTMVYDGSRYWTGSKALAGCAVDFRFDQTDCSMEYKHADTSWVVASCFAGEDGCFTCTPTFTTTNYTFSSASIGSPCSFGTITGVLSAA